MYSRLRSRYCRCRSALVIARSPNGRPACAHATSVAEISMPFGPWRNLLVSLFRFATGAQKAPTAISIQ
jgi:hypothetical protein